MADENLRRTIWIFNGKFHGLFLRPVGIVLFIAVAWSFYYGIRRSVREGGKFAEARRQAKSGQRA